MGNHFLIREKQKGYSCWTPIKLSYVLSSVLFSKKRRYNTRQHHRNYSTHKKHQCKNSFINIRELEEKKPLDIALRQRTDVYSAQLTRVITIKVLDMGDNCKRRYDTQQHYKQRTAAGQLLAAWLAAGVVSARTHHLCGLWHFLIKVCMHSRTFATQARMHAIFIFIGK